MLLSIRRFFNFFPPLIKEGKDSFLFGLLHSHGHSASAAPATIYHTELPRDEVIFQQGTDGKWRKDNITIEVHGASGFKIRFFYMEGEEGVGREARERREGDEIVMYADHLWVMHQLLHELYNGATPKYTSLAEHKPANTI